MNVKTIILIEDNPDNRLLTQAILESEYEIICFEDGLSALSGLASTNPALILLDISLPGMDGLEVLKHILKKNKKLCLIILRCGFFIIQSMIIWKRLMDMDVIFCKHWI